MLTCELCANPAQHLVPGYKLMVCEVCWSDAAHGWAEDLEPTLFAALAARGLLIPDRGDNDLLPRSYAPPEDFNI
ncbi:hypothetical protein N9H90_07240 [Pseudomonadales bacterium]|nr:hypothetical protein [Pseudomonadales bacterium]MDB9756483.1 hypothetical protein [Pseudomonadales bacterium]